MEDRLDTIINDHIGAFASLLSNEAVKKVINSVGELFCDCVKNNGSIFFFGNGGSAADSQHIVTEFVSRFYKERKAINAEALTVNSSILTAIGNDYSFSRVFSRQIEARCREGDIVVGISTSGKSENVLNGLYYARKIGLKTVLLTSNINKDTIDVDYIIKVPSVDVPRVQEMHIFIGHYWAEYVESKLDEI